MYKCRYVRIFFTAIGLTKDWKESVVETAFAATLCFLSYNVVTEFLIYGRHVGSWSKDYMSQPL